MQASVFVGKEQTVRRLLTATTCGRVAAAFSRVRSDLRGYVPAGLQVIDGIVIDFFSVTEVDRLRPNLLCTILSIATVMLVLYSVTSNFQSCLEFLPFPKRLSSPESLQMTR